MKHYRQKILRALFAGGLFLGSVMPVYAETVISQGSTGITPSRGNNGYSLRYKTVNGDPAYCMEAGTVVSLAPDAYEVTDLGNYSGTLHSGKVLSEAERREIGEIAYFSFGYEGREDYRWYAAAQDMIWQITDGGGTFFAGCGLESYEQAIRDSIAAYHAKPVFHVYDGEKEVSRNSSGIYPVTAESTVTVKDTSGVLSQYEILSVTGADLLDRSGKVTAASAADLSQNMFRLKTKDLNAVTVQMQRKSPASQAPKLLFSESGDQKMIVRGYLTSLSPVRESLNLVSEGIDVSIRKTDLEGHDIAGAELILKDRADGKVCDRWISDGTAHTVRNLIPSHSYELSENGSPVGYYPAGSLTFVPKDTPAAVMKDAPVEVSVLKVNELGQPVKGIRLQLTEADDTPVKDADGKEVIWETGTEAYSLGRYVCAGKTYHIRELAADDSYYLTVFEFAVPEQQPAQPLVFKMTNEHIRYRFAKKDPDGNYVSGAVLRLLDESDGGRTVLEWTTTQEDFTVNTLRRGHTYRLQEIRSPGGWYPAEDIVFTVSEMVPEDGEQIVVMTDRPIEILAEKKDPDGKPVTGAELTLCGEDGTVIETWVTAGEPHRIDGSKLCADQKYRLIETRAPKGYRTAEPVEFSLTGTADGPVTIVMEDEKLHVRVLKKDPSGEPLEGAVLRLFEKGSDEVLDEWTTVKEPHDISVFVEEGHTYILQETECPAGYSMTAEKEFTVEAGIGEITVEMTDEANDIVFRKTDPSGKPIAGACFEIRTESGEMITSWTSDEREEGVRLSDDGRVIAELLKGNETYILHETKAPFGCIAAEDTPFTMTGTAAAPQTVAVTNAYRPFALKVYKCASDEKEHMLAGAEFTVYRYVDDSPAQTADGTEASGRTDENGMLSFTLPYDPEGYYLRETKAPSGYVRSEDVIPVHPDETFDFSHPYEVTVENVPHTPETGDAAHYWMTGLLMSLAAASAGLIVLRRSCMD